MNKIKLFSLVVIILISLGLVVCYSWYRIKQTVEKREYQQASVTTETSDQKEGVLVGEISGEMSASEENRKEQSISESGDRPDFFLEEGTFEETGDMGSSLMSNWWLNSGAYFTMKNGIGSTVQGELPRGDKRQISYKNYNASETDGGFHPQNIFRLVTKTKWQNFDQECYYKINRYIVSDDKNRSASNGLLLFNRYQDQDNLYYTGLRVDGTVVVKKKIKGEYFLMAQKQVYPGIYGRKKNPNLLPLGKWLGVRSEVKNNADGTVAIKVFIDKNRTGDWQLIVQTTDDGKQYGGAVIKNEGYAGIRTDFMDVEFDDYRIEGLK